MTPKNKRKTETAINGIKTGAITNLWAGIQMGLGLFDKSPHLSNGKAPALMILTDGMPNHM